MCVCVWRGGGEGMIIQFIYKYTLQCNNIIAVTVRMLYIYYIYIYCTYQLSHMLRLVCKCHEGTCTFVLVNVEVSSVCVGVCMHMTVGTVYTIYLTHDLAF